MLEYFRSWCKRRCCKTRNAVYVEPEPTQPHHRPHQVTVVEMDLEDAKTMRDAIRGLGGHTHNPSTFEAPQNPEAPGAIRIISSDKEKKSKP